MKLHHVNDGPPSLACRMTLKALNIPYELIDVNYNIGEHLTDEYAKVNKFFFSCEMTQPIRQKILFSVESAERNTGS